MSIEIEKLPLSWSVATLREVSTKIVDGSHNPPQKQSSGRPMLSARNVENNQIVFNDYRLIADEDFDREHLRTKVTPGDVLLTIVGTIGRTTVVLESTPEFTLQRSVAVITPKELLPKFLMYQFQAPFFQKYFEVSARGTAQKGVYLKTLGASPVIVAPLDDQKRIVAEIEIQFSRLDEAVASLKRIQANLKRYKAAVLKAAVEGKLTEQWRKDHPAVEPAEQLLKRILAERRAKWEAEELAKMKAKEIKPKDDSWKKKFKEPVGPDIANLPELPDGWVWTSTGELCDCIVPNRDKPKTFSGDIPWITLPDFEDNAINIYRSKSEMGLSKEETSKYNARLIPKGSVVMSCVGRFGIVGIAQTDIVVNQQLHGFLMPTEMVTGYFAYAIKTQVPYMNSISTATTIAYLNKENCNSVPIALPPIKEQKEILAEIDRRLSVTEELEATAITSIKRADRLRQTILHQAFSGGLV